MAIIITGKSSLFNSFAFKPDLLNSVEVFFCILSSKGFLCVSAMVGFDCWIELETPKNSLRKCLHFNYLITSGKKNLTSTFRTYDFRFTPKLRITYLAWTRIPGTYTRDSFMFSSNGIVDERHTVDVHFHKINIWKCETCGSTILT